MRLAGALASSRSRLIMVIGGDVPVLSLRMPRVYMIVVLDHPARDDS
jgi:hypothetical protein